MQMLRMKQQLDFIVGCLYQNIRAFQYGVSVHPSDCVLPARVVTFLRGLAVGQIYGISELPNREKAAV